MLLNILIGILFIWVIALSVFVYNSLSHYNNLTKGIEKKSLKTVLEDLLKREKDTSEKIGRLILDCQQIKEEGIPHFQKIGLIRFNPFSDTGGNQSFVLALLDGKNDGIVISSLHSRTETRWYAKKIINGKSQEYEFSEEEKKAIEQAIKSNKTERKK